MDQFICFHYCFYNLVFNEKHIKFISENRHSWNELIVGNKDFEPAIEYLDVQEVGLYNMFDPNARALSNLSKSEWVHIIADYDKFAKAWLDKPNEK